MRNFNRAPSLLALSFLIPLTTGDPNMEQQRILLINFGIELARLATDILGENNFEVQSVENPEKMNTTSQKNFLRKPDRLFKLQSFL